jgi:PST family polysaccharide transporter
VITESSQQAVTPVLTQDLPRQAAKGAIVACVFQGANFVLRLGSMLILARLLAPEDFGLVAMVTAITGLLGTIKEVGLLDATVQSANINQDRLSALFWVNGLVGGGLSILCGVGAYAVASFYGEPRLFWIMIAVGSTFVFSGLSVQHRALLWRNLRIQLLGAIDLAALGTGIAVSIAMALAGFGYWALVASAVIWPAGSAIGFWLASGWIPGRPRRGTGAWRMITYGSAVTLYGIVVYITYNAEKVLLGRFWGAETLGLYGRAYTLINLPTDNLLLAIGSVAFPALARVQDDPLKFRRYFLNIYSSFLALVVPILVIFAVFAEDVVRVFLGSQWTRAAVLLQLLAPSILVITLTKPLSWLLMASGRVQRNLKIALVTGSVALAAYLVGVSRAADGVATSFSAAMVLLLPVVLMWSKRDTLITGRDLGAAAGYPVGSSLVAALVARLFWPWISSLQSPLIRLAVSSSLFFAVYLMVLLFVFAQRDNYMRRLEQTGFFGNLFSARRPSNAPSPQGAN